MEADWEVELGAGAPVIDPHWPGFVDLRVQPEQAYALPEVDDLPALGEALIALNSPASPVWTAKCDVWPADAFDPDELDGPSMTGLQAMGCYIDLLPKSNQHWQSASEVTHWCRGMCERMRTIALSSCRVDLVVRHANLREERLDYGVTAYLTAAGVDHAAIVQVMSSALAALADSVCKGGDCESDGSQLQ